MTPSAFRQRYEDWGVDTRLDADVEAATVQVPGEDVLVVAFPLGDRLEWTLRLASDRDTFRTGTTPVKAWIHGSLQEREPCEH